MNTLCPECGFKVSIDEDGCCVACGATATGAGVDAVYERIRELEEEVERLNATIERNEKQAINAVDIWKNQAIRQRKRRKSAEAKLRAIAEQIRKHELNMQDEQDAYSAIYEIMTIYEIMKEIGDE